jgi:ornithine cyclodeaminase/alanine dehydrogenase-like protein (mu-crystallin family)
MRLLDAAATAAALPFGRLVPALRDAFAAGADVPDRHHHALPGGATLLLMPAWQSDWLGVKVVTVHPGNAARGLPAVHSTYLLSEAATGRPVLLLDGDTLTARRTAAASALAASFLACPDAGRLLLVGAGRVASLMPAAHRTVRRVREVRVWNPTAARADALVAALRRDGFDAGRTGDLQAAAAWADIISCATLSTAPLIEGDWLRPGTHLDLVGAFTPAMREADEAAIRRARVFVDTWAALHEAGELAALGEADVCGTLQTLCRGGPGRLGDEVTAFKSVGTALEDLAAAMLAVQGLDNPMP